MIAVTTTGGSRTVPLPLTAAVASRSELVDQLAAMLRAAREARPEAPLTSLEVDIPALTRLAARATIADTTHQVMRNEVLDQHKARALDLSKIFVPEVLRPQYDAVFKPK